MDESMNQGQLSILRRVRGYLAVLAVQARCRGFGASNENPRPNIHVKVLQTMKIQVYPIMDIILVHGEVARCRPKRA